MADNAKLIEKLRRWVACPDPFDTAHAAADALEAADAKTAAATAIIKNLVGLLKSVERDTHYSLHDGDYCIPYGTTGYMPAHMTDPCQCSLCDGRRFLAENVEKESV